MSASSDDITRVAPLDQEVIEYGVDPYFYVELPDGVWTQVQYATDEEFETVVCDSGWTRFGFTPYAEWLLPGTLGSNEVYCDLEAGTYYWRIRLGPEGDPSDWTLPWSFTLAAEPPGEIAESGQQCGLEGGAQYWRASYKSEENGSASSWTSQEFTLGEVGQLPEPVLVAPTYDGIVEDGVGFFIELEERRRVRLQVADEPTFADETLVCDSGWIGVGLSPNYWWDGAGCAFEAGLHYWWRARAADDDPENPSGTIAFSDWTDTSSFEMEAIKLTPRASSSSKAKRSLSMTTERYAWGGRRPRQWTKRIAR